MPFDDELIASWKVAEPNSEKRERLLLAIDNLGQDLTLKSLPSLAGVRPSDWGFAFKKAWVPVAAFAAALLVFWYGGESPVFQELQTAQFASLTNEEAADFFASLDPETILEEFEMEFLTDTFEDGDA